MNNSFSELVKLAKANGDDAKRIALEATKRREAAVRQEREEREKREKAEKEMQKKLMLKRVEDAKKEEERKKQKEEELAKRREELSKRKEAEREELRTGKSTSRASGSGSSKPRTSSYLNTTSTAMTREEKRLAKDPLYADDLGKGKAKFAAMKKLKNGRLPGGAIATIGTSGSSGSRNNSHSPIPTSAQSMTARARLAAGFAPTLTKLNTEKRDMRSLDEITRDLDLKKGKGTAPVDSEDKSTLSGYQASSYGNWFGKKEKTTESRSTNDTGRGYPSSSNRRSSPSSSTNPNRSKQANGSNSRPSPPRQQSSKKSGTSINTSSKQKGADHTNGRKRSRASSELENSDSYDSEDQRDRRPSKRPAPHRLEHEELGGDMRDLIWGIMGKNRKHYTAIEVDSDDDMEATGADLEREEMRSARLARKEDEAEEAAEKRRELEKKKKKMEKDRVVRK